MRDYWEKKTTARNTNFGTKRKAFYSVYLFMGENSGFDMRLRGIYRVVKN